MFGTPAQFFSRSRKNDKQEEPKPDPADPADDAEKARQAEGARADQRPEGAPEATAGKGKNRKR